MAAKKKTVNAQRRKSVGTPRTKSTRGKKTSKKPQKKNIAEFSDTNMTVLCCVYCNSPSVHKTILDSKEHYYCLRCGKQHLHINEKPLSECKDLLQSRKIFTGIHHTILRNKREKKFYILLDNFYMRMSFRLVSLLLIIGGFILTFSDFWTGMLFIIVGLVSLWTAETL